MASVIPTTIPHGQTARRLEWPFLPPRLRAIIEGHCGSPVVDAASQGAGFTPGFASVLTCADGSRHFVKAASTVAQRMFAESYRVEARKLAALPVGVPAPRLLWSHDADDWVALGIEYVEARQPARPWLPRSWTPPWTPWRSPLTYSPRLRPGWSSTPSPTRRPRGRRAGSTCATTRPHLPHLEEAAALAARFAEATAGSAVAHTDVRDDNILLTPDGRALLCDWNWPVLGAAVAGHPDVADRALR